MQNTQNLRNEIQQKAIASFLRSNGQACLEIGTGVGKSKIAIDILKELRSKILSPSVLILVDSTRLRDNEWITQFLKFECSLDNVQIECYQTAYRWAGRYFTIVIADEFDASLTEAWPNFYFNNNYDYLIALTAYITDSKRELADKIAPTCFKYTTQDAQKDGILNPTKFYQVNFDIGHVKDIEVKFGKNKERKFFQSENGMYAYLEDSFNKALWAMKANEGKLAQAVILDNEIDKYQNQVQKSLHQMKMFSRKRTDFLHTLKSSRLVTQALINCIHSSPNNKVLIFSRRIEQAEKITPHTYHSKNKNEVPNKLDSFSNGNIDTLAVCEGINRGVNLDSVNNLIQESYVGSDTNFQQKHGRGVRLAVDQTMRYFILVPHYWERVQRKNDRGTLEWRWERKPTQAKKWFDDMTSQFDISGIETIEMIHNQRTDSYTLPQEYDNLCSSS